MKRKHPPHFGTIGQQQCGTTMILSLNAMSRISGQNVNDKMLHPKPPIQQMFPDHPNTKVSKVTSPGIYPWQSERKPKVVVGRGFYINILK